MKKLKTKLPWLFAGLALVAALIYGYWPAAVPVDVTAVTRGSFDVTVDDDGETRIREKYVVSAPVGGKLLRVQLHAGDSVTRGMTELTNIEPNVPDLMDARMLAEASARLRAAEANVERSREILVQANTSMELATQHYARAQDLLPQKAMSQSEFDEIEQRYHYAEAAVRAATFSVNVATFELEHAQAAVAR